MRKVMLESLTRRLSEIECIKSVVLAACLTPAIKPPSSIPSERIFSTVGNIYDDRRNCLKGETIGTIRNK
ncbi:UNVERIFIED_CONTAM: hypothetical protein FKN15_020038 [Acipenser sinensis]